MTTSRVQTTAATNNAHRYNRGSVERAFTHHGVEFTRRGAGYVVSTGIGLVKLTTLRDAYLFVVAMAEKGRLMGKAAA